MITIIFVVPSPVAPSLAVRIAAFAVLHSGTTATLAVTYAAVVMNGKDTAYQLVRLPSQAKPCCSELSLAESPSLHRRTLLEENTENLAFAALHRYETPSARRRTILCKPRWEPKKHLLKT